MEKTMRLSFDHVEQRAGFWRRTTTGGVWLVCTVEFTETELEVLKNRNLHFEVPIGRFYVGHPNHKNLVQPQLTTRDRYLAAEMGGQAEGDYEVRLSLRYILSGKPICLAEIREAESLMTRVFSELKALIEANTQMPGKRTIEI